jgi:hypothetical protein
MHLWKEKTTDPFPVCRNLVMEDETFMMASFHIRVVSSRVTRIILGWSFHMVLPHPRRRAHTCLTNSHLQHASYCLRINITIFILFACHVADYFTFPGDCVVAPG